MMCNVHKLFQIQRRSTLEYGSFWNKVNIWNVKCARATTFIIDSRTDVLVKVSKIWRQKMSRPEREPPAFGFTPNALTNWTIRTRHLLSGVFEYWLWRYRYFLCKVNIWKVSPNPTMHLCHTHVHTSVTKWCIVWYLSDALTNFWDVSITIRVCWRLYVLGLIPVRISKQNPVKHGMKLLFHSKLTAPLKFGNGSVIHPTLYNGCTYLSMLWLKLTMFVKRVPDITENPVVKTTSVPQIAKFMGPTWGPPGSCRPQMGPMLALWTLLSGTLCAALYIGVCLWEAGNDSLLWDIFYKHWVSIHL